MMYCPQCLAQYDDDFTECSVCRIPVLTGLGEPRPGHELVTVLETNDRIQFAMAKGLLDDAGIPICVKGQIATLVQDVDGFLHKWVRIQVPREAEIEARELLEPLHRPVCADNDEEE